jgi:hypothetical protein
METVSLIPHSLTKDLRLSQFEEPLRTLKSAENAPDFACIKSPPLNLYFEFVRLH